MPSDDQPQGLQLTPRDQYEKIAKRSVNPKRRRSIYPQQTPPPPQSESDLFFEPTLESFSGQHSLGIDEAARANQDIETHDPNLVRPAELDSNTDLLCIDAKFGQIAKSMSPTFSQRFGPEDDDELPPHVDMRDYLPEPGSQGDQNSCVAWAVAHAAYSCQLSQERRRKKPTLKSDVFSPAFIYNKLGKNNRSLHALAVIDYVRENGCASEATMVTGSKACEFAEARNFRLLRNERADSLHELKSYIHEGYPVVLIVRMGKDFRDNAELRHPYLWEEDEPMGVNYHAVAAVGYDDDSESVLIMNSWGTEWKEDGYCWVSYSNFEEIDDRHWCAEAHIAGVKRIAPYNVWIRNSSSFSPFDSFSPFHQSRFNRRVFQLEDDRRVYEGDELITSEDWEVDDVACNKDTLFVLLRDQTVCRMDDHGAKGRKWEPLDVGKMAHRKVTMLAADDSASLHALTVECELMQYDITNGWSRADLPENAGDIIDVRVIHGDVHATNVDGVVYVRDRFDRWRIER